MTERWRSRARLHGPTAGRLNGAIVLLTALGLVTWFARIQWLHRMPRPVTSQRLLGRMGYRDIRITGADPGGCPGGEVFRTGFEANDPAGVRVTGTVCQGWFRGATVHLK